MLSKSVYTLPEIYSHRLLSQQRWNPLRPRDAKNMNMSVQTDPVYCYIGSATEQPTVMTGMTKLTVNTTVCTFRTF